MPLVSPPLQLDLIDLGGHRHRKYRYVLNYTCRFTKHVWLRPLRSKESAEVARQVMLGCFLVWEGFWLLCSLLSGAAGQGQRVPQLYIPSPNWQGLLP